MCANARRCSAWRQVWLDAIKSLWRAVKLLHIHYRPNACNMHAHDKLSHDVCVQTIGLISRKVLAAKDGKVAVD